MKRTTPAQAPAPTRERRSGGDRRQRETTTALRPERRRGVEPRKPEVVELDLTLSQWDALHAAADPAAALDKKRSD